MSEEATYKTIRAQNKTLYNSILNTNEMYSNNENRIKYKTINYEQTRYILTIVFYLYYAVFLIFMLMIFFSKTIKWQIKMIFVIFFLVYPFIIYFVENWFYQMAAYFTNVA
jgi:hypothetical protein